MTPMEQNTEKTVGLAGDGSSAVMPFARSDLFASWVRMVTRDLNSRTAEVTRFTKYSKEQIAKFLSNPASNYKQLREAVNYVYGASSHFRRLIQYFVGLSDLSYYVAPYKDAPHLYSKKLLATNYRKTLNFLSSMHIKTQMDKILTVCLREDVFYGTFIYGQDNIVVRQLPSDYCGIQSIEGNVINVTFNFAYFDRHPDLLGNYPDEFREKYRMYKDRVHEKWIELDAPNSFAVKCSADILNYPIPPFAGVLREIYDIEDYANLKLERTRLENYAMLVMKLLLSDDGRLLISDEDARAFFANLDAVIPESVGAVLSPMDIEKISFEKAHNNDTDTISEAEENLFTAAGVSSLLFNNAKASANALLLSIKADQAITYGIVKSIGDVINRYLQSFQFGKNFKVVFLDVSPYNRKEVGDAYLKAASYGLPTISMYAASQGLGQEELDSMSFLETEVLGLQDMFRPIVSSTQVSADDLDGGGATDEGGRPQKDMEDLTESGEQNREDA